MIDHPILFSAPMVRAILAGTKTQTRRVAKGLALQWLEEFSPEFVALPENGLCPYGQPGDRLWVRETFFAWGRWETRYSAKKGRDEWHFVDMTLECGKAYEYPATGGQPQSMGGKRHIGGTTPAWWKRPAIHMPRAASRITQEITSVRVERLQEISEADAAAEGVIHKAEHKAPWSSDGMRYWPTARDAFADLWRDINGPESWDANPWVWAITFKRIESTT